jgi:HAD superfamily hydrolase (TIGR01549 family)
MDFVMKIIKTLKEMKLDIHTKAVIFDCFGTLIKIEDKQNPYRFIYEEFVKLGGMHNDFYSFIMTKNLSFKDIEKEIGIDLPQNIILDFFNKLNKEIVSINKFEETNQVLNALRKSGMKIALCSNLASPYGHSVLTELPNLDHYFLSYKLGMLKPNMDMFKYCQETLGLAKKEILFIGDSRNADYNGALAYGFNSTLLMRDKSRD